MAIKFLSGQTISGTLTVSGNVQGATFNGLAINTTGTNNVANQIVRTQANGYANFGWINSVSGNHTGTITRITASNDAYLRYVTPAQFRTGVTDGFYAPSSTVSGVTSVATGNGLTGGTITTTGTLTMSGDYTGIFTVHEGRVWDPTTQGVSKGSIHIDPDEGTDHAGGAITFGASDASAGNNAQAGIYIRSDGSYGTRMYLATTDSYATGSKTALNIDHSGNVNITRGFLQISNGNLTLAGTGRIQGVDTVSASTDAANKAYVDAHPGSGGTVTSVATGSGLTGGTITTTGTLSVDSTVIRTTGTQSITGNTTFYPSSTSTGYSTAAIELMASSSGASGTPPRIAWHWGGVVASSMTIESNGTIAVRNNPGNDYEQFKASTITATSSMLSPIYYDSANGAYYGDFASTSVFNKINTGIGNLGRSSMASYSMTAGNWYRIANGSGRSCGDIYIQDGISSGPHGNLTFYAGSSYSQYAGTMLKLKSSSFYNVIGFTEIRLLIGTTYQDQYVEVYCQRTGTYNITVQDTHSATNQWILSTSATVGSVPTGYSDSTRLDINGMLIAEAGNGSNRFAVDRVGAIHLSGGTSGSSGQVLTSGGTGSPTWTTLQNQTGGPFLPLAGGIMSGEIGRSAFNSGYQVGGYNNIGVSHAKTNPIHVIGTSYEPTATALSNMYGIGYTRGDASFVAATSGWGMYVAADGNSRIFLDGQNGGIGTANNSWRAPIFYDSNNTGYYVDPASTSVLNGLTVAGYSLFGSGLSTGSWYGDLGSNGYTRETGLAMTGGSEFVVLSKNGQGSTLVDGAYLAYESANGFFGSYNSTYGNLTGIQATAANTLTVKQLDGGAAILSVTQDVRAPIFYDSANTAYYCDPASTSKFNDIWTTDGGNNGTAPRWDTSFYVAQSQHYYGHSSTQTMYIGESNTINIRSIGIASGSLRAPIFYDSNNTGYYVDPASTSQLNVLNCAGTLTVTGAGGVIAPKFTDYNNGSFYLDPSSTGTSLNVAGDVVAYASSDIRFKNNVLPITNALDKINKIGGYTFEWNEKSHKETGKKDIGVIAQEVEDILPEIVDTRDNGYKAVDYSKLTALLIQSVKEQQVIIDNLKSRIETLENN